MQTERTRKHDRLRPLSEIQEEVARIRLAVGVPFLSLDTTQRAAAIVRHRSFISQRVNRVLWACPTPPEKLRRKRYRKINVL